MIKDADTLFLWLDCDREGEAIAFDVIETCKEIKQDFQIFWAHFSAITKKEITDAFKNLKPADKNQSDAVEVR